MRQGITNAKGLEVLLPSAALQMERQNVQMFIRGVGQAFSLSNFEQGVAMYADGHLVGRNATGAGFFDVETVEVLPGPQGTLYGRNALGGVINVNTTSPTSEFEASAMFEVGDYDLYHATGVVNVPVSDQLMLRLAVDSHRHSGYFTSGADDLREIAGRLSVLYVPTDDLSILVRGLAWHNGGKGYGTADFPYIDKDHWFQDGSFDTRGGISRDQDMYSISAEIVYNFGNDLTLTWLPGYQQFEGESSAIQQSGFSRGTTLVSFEESDQFSNEIRLAQSTEQYKWVVGLYQYKAESPDNSLTFNISGYNDQPPPQFQAKIGPFSTDWESYGAFTQVTYSIRPGLRLVGGLRYSRDTKEGDGSQTNSLTGEGFGFPIFGYSWTFDKTWTNVSWKAGVEADVLDSSMFYANVSTGYQQGGYELFPDLSQTLDGPAREFDPVEVLAFTVGMKNRFFGDRLQINDEFFFYSYDDFQAAGITPSLV